MINNKDEPLLVSMKASELRRLVLLIERMNEFLHQPMNYPGSKETDAFAIEVNPELRFVYYSLFARIVPFKLAQEIWDLDYEDWKARKLDEEK